MQAVSVKYTGFICSNAPQNSPGASSATRLIICTAHAPTVKSTRCMYSPGAKKEDFYAHRAPNLLQNLRPVRVEN